MAGRLYWEMLKPLVPADSTTLNNALNANPTLKMYGTLYYKRRYENARISMGYGPAPSPMMEDTGGSGT